jgi:hypothetical protein
VAESLAADRRQRAGALSVKPGDSIRSHDALLSSSPGASGGLRAMHFMRQYLQRVFAMIVKSRA